MNSNKQWGYKRTIYIILFAMACIYCTAQNSNLMILSDTGDYTFSAKGNSLVFEVYADKDTEWKLEADKD